MSDLTDLQQRFVLAYVGEARFNATEAASLAGYKGSRQTLRAIGAENLTKPHIDAAIKKRTERFVMRQDEAAYRYAEIARSDFADFFDIVEEENDEGEVVERAQLNVTRLIKEGPSHLVKELKWTKFGPTVKGYDMQRALEKVLEMHGAFGAKGTEDDPIHTKSMDGVDVSELTSEQIAKLAAGEDPEEVL